VTPKNLVEGQKEGKPPQKENICKGFWQGGKKSLEKKKKPQKTRNKADESPRCFEGGSGFLFCLGGVLGFVEGCVGMVFGVCAPPHPGEI